MPPASLNCRVSHSAPHTFRFAPHLMHALPILPPLSHYRYEQPKKVEQTTNIINYVFTVYFGLEMLVKLVGLGLRKYASEGMNWFDGIVTVAGLVEMALDFSPANNAMGSYLSVLRAFRLLRVFRLARSWKSLNRIIRILLTSFAAVSWLTALLLLFMFICGLLGMQVGPFESGSLPPMKR